MTTPLEHDEALALLPLLAGGDLEPDEAARLRAAVDADPRLAPEAARLEAVHALLARSLGRALEAAPLPVAAPPDEADVAFGRFLVLAGFITADQGREAFHHLQAYRVQRPEVNLAQVLARHGLCPKERLLAAHEAFLARCAGAPAVVGTPVDAALEPGPAEEKAPPKGLTVRFEPRPPERARRGRAPLVAGVAAVLALGGSAAAFGVAAVRQRQKAEFLAAVQGALDEGKPSLEEALDRRGALPGALADDGEVEVAGKRLVGALARRRAREASRALLATLPVARDADERLAISGRAVEADPTHADALVARARARFAVARTKAAAGGLGGRRADLTTAPLVDLDEAIRQEPDAPRAHVVKGLLLRGRSDAQARQQAEDALRAALRKDPAGALGALADGLLLAGTGQLDAAIDAFTRAVGRDPTLLDAYLARAEARLRKREYGRALDDANEAARQDPASADALGLQAEARYFSSGSSDRAGALRSVERALALDPGHSRALALRAYARLERDRFGDVTSPLEDRTASKRDAERALAVFAEEPLAHLALAELAAETNPVEAKQHASRAIECGRHLVQTWMCRGRLRGREADEYAIQDFEEVLRLSPRNVHALTNKAAVLFAARRDAEQAMALLDQAIELDPTMPWAYYWRGMILLAPPRHARKYERAAAEFSEAITLQPQFPDAYFRRACAYHDTGRYADCLKDLDTAEAQRVRGQQGASSASEGLFQLHWLELTRGHCLFFTRQYPEAEAAYRRYLAAAPPGDKALPGVVRRLDDLRRLGTGELTPEQLQGE
jgi:tetratricopeptide (TPR) repeat protein